MAHGRQRNRIRPLRSGFSLVELVIVVTIIGIVASIAVPRMTNAAVNAQANALQATMANVRKAIDVYYAEHSSYPGYTPGNGAVNHGNFVDQLVMYTSENGNTNASPSTTFQYGPYLRSPFPRNPSNTLQTVYVKALPGDADPAAGAYGWIAVLSHGYFGVSMTDSELEDIGITDPKLKDAVRARPF